LWTLQILFNLQQQYEQNQARKEYIAAMNRFKSDPPEIKKSKHVFYNSKSGTVDYWHSDLDDIVSGVSSKLAECGLDMHWETDQGDEGRIKVSCVLTHYLGHTKSVTLYGSPDQSGGKNNIQAVGSTVKYLQRYTAMAVLGLSDSDIDNDAINPSIGDSQPQQTQQQANELPEYPDNLFQQNLPKWRKALSGGKTHSAIINTIKSRYTLTAEQEKKINTLQPEETNGNS